MTKTKPCTLGPRHKWEFVRNKTFTTATLHTRTLSVRGVYKCACGAKKIGEMNHFAPDAN